MKKRAELTVFLSMILVCMFALICSFVETARTAGARWYLQLAVNSAVDSLFSQYHQEMWEDYHIFGYEYSDQEDIKVEINKYLVPYLEAENWYPMRLEQVNNLKMDRLVDESAIYFQQEVLDYMKYGIWADLDIMPEMGEKLLVDLKDAQGIFTITNAYSKHTKEAVKLELILEDIGHLISHQSDKYNQAVRSLEREEGDDFILLVKEIQDKNKQIPKLVNQYQIDADHLSAQLEKTKIELENISSDLRIDNYHQLIYQFSEYESYVATDGERRKEIEDLLQMTVDNDLLLEQLIDEVIEVQYYIDEWDGDDEELNKEKLWRPIKRRFEQYNLSELSFSYGVKNKEKQSLLEGVNQMVGLNLLSFVLPDGVEASKTILPLENAPSLFKQNNVETDQGNLIHRILVNEYCNQVFDSFLSPIKKDVQYEIEYLIAGKGQDDINLEGALLKILAIREGLNFIHLLLDSQKREEARTLANLIAGVTGLESFVSIITCFILVTWALGESIVDIRILLDGGKIPLLKDQHMWQLSLEQLLDMGKNKVFTTTPQNDSGFDYHGYLKLLLLLEPSTQKYYRMMDMIQINLRRRQNKFLMESCLYRVDIEVVVCGKHVFSSLGFVENLTKRKDHQYIVYAETEKTY